MIPRLSVRRPWCLGLVGFALSLPGAGEAGTVQVNVQLQMSAQKECIATLKTAAGSTARVYQSKRDLMTWNIVNECKRQLVRVCITPTDKYSATNPVRKCNGEPGDAEIEDDFEVDAADAEPGYATISCRVRWSVLDDVPKTAEKKRKYLMQVRVGPDAKLNCPDPPRRRRLSELALEVDP